MIAELFAASGSRHLVICDPSLLPAAPDLRTDPLDSRIADMSKDGRALLIHIPEGDCEASVRVFIDEQPPIELRNASSKAVLDGFELQLPSGTLQAAGADDIGTPLAERDSETYRVVPVPAATFVGRAFHTITWKTRQRNHWIAQRTSALARRLQRIQNVIGFGVAVLFPAHLVLFLPLVLVAFRASTHTGIRSMIALAAFDFAVWLICVTVAWANRRHPVLSQVRNVSEVFEQEYPDIVVILASFQQESVRHTSNQDAILVIR